MFPWIHRHRKSFKYKLDGIDSTFLDEVSGARLGELMDSMRGADVSQDTINSVYDDFCDHVHSVMDTKLRKMSVNRHSSLSDKRRRIKKPWWSDELSRLWNALAQCEDIWIKARPVDKPLRKADMKSAQKRFDRAVQSAKRQYWRQQQEYLLSLPQRDPSAFWKHIGQLGVGQDRRRNIPMEIVAPDGSVSNDHDTVMTKWRDDFCHLLNPVNQDDVGVPDPGDQDHIEHHFNDVITRQEVVRALTKAKKNKAMGVDNIPVETLCSDNTIDLLHTLFAQCFSSSVVPEAWRRSIVTPIPKCSTSDPRVPLNYRGIMLSSHIYKLYCSVLNDRLSDWVEQSDLLCDEQNGFRPGRSCGDQLSTFTNIINTRRKMRKQTFGCFVDFSKAYERICRTKLWSKLSNYNINGNMLNAIKSMYDNYMCCVKVNGFKTDWFNVECGLKQGCILSPLLFNLFINDLTISLKQTGKGINVGNVGVCGCYSNFGRLR